MNTFQLRFTRWNSSTGDRSAVNKYKNLFWRCKGKEGIWKSSVTKAEDRSSVWDNGWHK